MSKYLDSWENPEPLKNMDRKQLEELAEEIRAFLIANVAKTGGHLSSNLGVVELTIALHTVFDYKTDKIFFDVGHQSYTHKILTGRAAQFDSLRQYQGLSGFQKRSESEADVWEAGHSSTALSAALGMAAARDLNGEHYHIVPVIGDASIVGGESLEALNNLGGNKTRVIIVLNDNQMSISKTMGGISQLLGEIRISEAYNSAKHEYRDILKRTAIGRKIYSVTSRTKNRIRDSVIDSKIFGEFGVDYLGPINGHDFHELLRALRTAKQSERPIVVHVVTIKGKGYPLAECDTHGDWHGVEPFNPQTGELLKPLKETCGQYAAGVLHTLMRQDKDIVAITPAMRVGAGLERIFHDFPGRSFDVGIAEDHAATFAAGLAIAGKKPFLSYYSSFLQRAYDQLLHDIARMNLPVVVGVDRVGLAEGDGETHHGLYDAAILKTMPNTTIFTASCKTEISWFIQEAFHRHQGLAVIRYGKDLYDNPDIDSSHLRWGKWVSLGETEHPEAVVISYGEAFQKIYDHYKDQPLRLIDASFLRPLDMECLNSLEKVPVFVYEPGYEFGSLAMDIKNALYGSSVEIYTMSYPEKILPQGKAELVLKDEECSLDDFYELVRRVRYEA